MGEESSSTGGFFKRIGIIVFATLVALLGAHELQRRHSVKNKGASPSNIAGIMTGELDFTKPDIAERVEARAQMKNEHTETAKSSTRSTLHSWIDRLLK